MLFRFDSEGVHVDVLLGDAGVVLERLHEAEVRTLACVKSVVSVELKVRADNGVVRTVVELVTRFGLCDNPYKLLHGVVEVEAVGTVLDGGFITGELELFDEEFVLRLSETLALVGVEVDVINVERHRGFVSRRDTASAMAEIRELGEGEVNLDFVVLEGNEGKRKTVVTVEEELKGNVESGTGSVGVRDIRYTTDHFRVEHTLLSLGCAEFGPDVEPFAVVTVDALASDFKFDFLDKVVSDVGVPLPTIGKSGKLDFEYGVRDKITIAADCAAYATTKGCCISVESLLD